VFAKIAGIIRHGDSPPAPAARNSSQNEARKTTGPGPAGGHHADRTQPHQGEAAGRDPSADPVGQPPPTGRDSEPSNGPGEGERIAAAPTWNTVARELRLQDQRERGREAEEGAERRM
jgi:hypothetical protein